MNDTIYLRKVTVNDIDFLKVIYNDETIQNFSLNVERGEIGTKEILNTIQYFETNLLDFFIIMKFNKAIGVVSIYEIDNREKFAMIGMALVKEYRGRNIGKIVLHLLFRHLMNNYNICHIRGEVYSNNIASLRFMEKMDFIRNEAQTKDMKMNGKVIQRYVYDKSIYREKERI